MSKILDTIIIGAGWAGVISAHDIAMKGHSVLVLEARDRIGGRARTYSQGMHAPIDLGCSWIHGYNEGNPAKEIAREIGVTAYLSLADIQQKTHLPNPTGSLIYDTNGNLPSSVVLKLRSMLSEVHKSVGAFAEDATPPIHHQSSFSSFLFSPQGPLFTSFGHKMAEDYARTLEVPLGAPLEKLSLRWAGWEKSFSGSDAAPEGGFQPLVEKIFSEATKFGANIRFGKSVSSLHCAADGLITVTTEKEDYKALTVICTIPLGVLQHNPPKFDPELPFRRRQTIAETHVGTLEKLVLAYPRAWWPDGDSIGSFTFLPSRSVPSEGSASPQDILAGHTISVVSFSAIGLPNPHPTLLFYLSSTPVKRLVRFSSEEVIKGAHAFLVDRIKPSTEPPEPVASVMTNWLNDPLAMGATTTPSVFGERQSPLDFMELGRPLWRGRLGFAGEHTDPNHRGSIAGAIISGRREAERVNRLLTLLSP